VVGIKLPGLEFNNQKVEAAYRKELVYGEDHAARAAAAACARAVFRNVRKNYYRLYFHYLYFGIARGPISRPTTSCHMLLVPTVVAGRITLGVFTQINRVRSGEESFKFLPTPGPRSSI
jgi:peptide/bleomycin uptake transporter